MANEQEIKCSSEEYGDPHARETDEDCIDKGNRSNDHGLDHAPLRSSRVEIHGDGSHHVLPVLLAEEARNYRHESGQAAQEVCNAAFQHALSGLRFGKRPSLAGKSLPFREYVA